MANMWQYETLSATQDGLKDDLNRLGKLGYQVIHLKEADSQYFVILARDTGRPIDEGEDRSEDWLVDVVTSPESQLDGT
jgi:hypothetical protein